MQSTLSWINRFFEQAPNSLLTIRWTVVFSFLLFSVFTGYGLFTKFQMDMSIESWFQEDDPARASLKQFRQEFGSDDGIYIVYEAADGDVFSEKSLQTIRDLHTELDNARVGLDHNGQSLESELQRVDRLDSLYNARYQLADGDTLISKKLIAQDYPSANNERENKRNIAKSQDSFELAYYSTDYKYGGIRIKTDFGTIPLNEDLESAMVSENDLLADDEFEIDNSTPELSESAPSDDDEILYKNTEMNEYLDIMTALRSISEKEKYQHFTFYYSGNAPFMEFAMQSMKKDMMLVLLMLAIVFVMLLSLFRSFSAVVWPVLVIFASSLWTFGLASWAGVVMSTMISLTFMLILAVGIADCVHVLSTYLVYRRENIEHREAMTKAYRKTGLPIFLTTITTMAGMMALGFSDIPQIQTFGFCSAVGVFMAFVLTLFVLPVFLDIWHPHSAKQLAKKSKPPRVSRIQSQLKKIPGFVARRAPAIVICYFTTFVLFIFGATQIKINTNYAELTREGSSIRTSVEIIDEHMMGGQNMEILLEFNDNGAIKTPEVLSSIDKFQQHIEEKYPDYVIKTFSIADFVNETHKVLQQGKEEFFIVPADPMLAAQLLYLFDNANPEDRRNLVNDEYSKTHITIQLKNAGSYEYTELFDLLRVDLNHFFKPLEQNHPDASFSATGSLPLMMELIDHISRTQLKSFSIALVIITLFMMVSLGSVQAGLISIVPNLLPAFFTFGLLGIFDIPLDTDTLLIAPLIIGIAVDDTIHFIAHYRDAWFEHGDVDKALESTIRDVGQAVTFTTLILGLGFSMLAFSDYLGLAKTGIFGSIAIFVALSSDLFLLPALVKWLKPDLGRTQYLAKQNAQEQTA